MRFFIVPAVAFLVGAGIWIAGEISRLGSIEAESSDPTQKARVVAEQPVPRYLQKVGGAFMASAILGAGIGWSRRKQHGSR